MAKYKALATMRIYMDYEFDADSLEEAWDKAEEAGDDGLFVEVCTDYQIDEILEVLE